MTNHPSRSKPTHFLVGSDLDGRGHWISISPKALEAEKLRDLGFRYFPEDSSNGTVWERAGWFQRFSATDTLTDASAAQKVLDIWTALEEAGLKARGDLSGLAIRQIAARA